MFLFSSAFATVAGGESMTEQEWFACTAPYLMLDALKGTPWWDEGKMRRFACWCARQVWDFLLDQRSRTAVEVAERFADVLATTEELAAAENAAAVAHFEACEAGEEWATAEAAGAAAATVARDAIDAAKGAAAGQAAAMASLTAAEKAEPSGAAAELAQADKLREMFGNPFGCAH
ncbi:MAG TPA: hypothetical protein VKE98_13270 [Gemmataceae bacterium]|nr:hypothetical protein [Gemmataceae bacterium]